MKIITEYHIETQIHCEVLMLDCLVLHQEFNYNETNQLFTISIKAVAYN